MFVYTIVDGILAILLPVFIIKCSADFFFGKCYIVAGWRAYRYHRRLREHANLYDFEYPSTIFSISINKLTNIVYGASQWMDPITGLWRVGAGERVPYDFCVDECDHVRLAYSRLFCIDSSTHLVGKIYGWVRENVLLKLKIIFRHKENCGWQAHEMVEFENCGPLDHIGRAAQT